MLAVPHTGMAVTIDIGKAGDIHPKNNQEVESRLALLELADVYKMKIPSRGPEFAKLAIKGSELELTFNHAEEGLVAQGEKLCGFVIAVADQKWFPAVARIKRDRIVLSATEVPEPIAVRYGWADNPECNLYNQAGLPMSPFRTDTWN